MSTMMAEGVGKRIVDALKMQSELEIIDKTQSEMEENIASEGNIISEDIDNVESVENSAIENDYQEPVNAFPQQQFQSMNYNTPQSSVNSLNYGMSQNISSEFANLEVPQNVAILRQLISQLPGGVSRQAGALVIKQTMEALGISMKSVLQEAQQLQESLNLSARECQSSILECKKQINNLELQVQQYQKQSSSLNEIVSLFVQVN